MLGIDDDEFLLEAMGRRQQLLVCKETPVEWELVCPPALVATAFSDEL